MFKCFPFLKKKNDIECVLRTCVAIGDNVVELSGANKQSLLAIPIRSSEKNAIHGSSIMDNPTHHHGICIFDIDDFKHINDTLGYVFKDEVILLITVLMKKLFSDENILFRYGGDEFVVILHSSFQKK
ncbi:diguanylate cyclase [Candidatus Enterovibrio altilux]|uniref:diguanylate cyclase n=1 Tax=Candidatus Enterovibrio altilux TaxID=1927128 RepID=UPI001F2456CD|nr:diguanylate cyclase [Candidatus Enterovibrio luxaltus]